MNNEQTKKAIVEKRKKSSITWLIPLVALLATSWLIYKSISEAGVDIVVNFKSGNGFKAGKTMVFYKGYNLGKISKVTVGNDLQSVNAHITISNEAANFITREGTEFWIVKPKFSVSEISGLDTIISGVYIEVRPPSIDIEKIEKMDSKFSFKGHDEKPLKYYREDGLNITLIAKNLSGISTGTPIFYKKFKIGAVIATKLHKDNVSIFLNIQKSHVKLLNKSTVFWNVSGVKIDASLGGVNVEMDSLTSLIAGGISLETVDLDAAPINGRDEFVLYDNYEGINRSKSMVKLIFDSARGLQKNKTLLIYKGIAVGKIKDIKLIDEKIVATAYLDKEYAKFNTKDTKYHKVDLAIDGIKIKNLETLLGGIYINIIPGEGEFNNTFEVFNTKAEALKEELLNIVIRSEKLNNINIGSKVYYKNIVIGAVTAYKFGSNMEEIIIKAGVNKKYAHLINDKTLLYSISTPLIESKNFDLNVNFEGLEPLLNGGIGLEYTKSKNKMVPKRFWLYDSYNDLIKVKQKYTDGKRIRLQINERTNLTEGMSLMYRNNKIGFVESFDYSDNTSFTTIFIDKKYSNIIKKHTKFYKQGAFEAKANIEKITIKLASVGNLLKGNIILTNAFKTQDESISNNFKYKLYDDFDDLPIKKHSVALTFSNIEGLSTNDVRLMYKGIQVGVVDNITLNKNLFEFNAQAYIYDEYKEIAASSSAFYIVKPNISLAGVTGLDTIIKGSYINIIQGEGSLINSFFVHNTKPAKSRLNKGLQLTLVSHNSGSLSTSSAVYYKKIKVGEVESIDLASNAKFVNIKVFIENKYKSLVRQNSEFFNVSGIDMDVSLVGAKIKADSLNTVIFGGISFATPNKFGKKAYSGQDFKLHDSIKEEWEKYNPEIIME